MLFSASYSALIGLVVITSVLFVVIFCIRLNNINRHIAPMPMQVVVLAQPDYHEQQHAQMCWSIPMEQPPPPYNAVIARMNNDPNVININNLS